jgi:hypothetical protein
LKTLLFCTSFFATPGAWNDRYARWVAHYRSIDLWWDAIFAIDDASPIACPDPAITVLDALPQSLTDHGIFMYRFAEHLGRPDVLDYPGWWRSFLYAEKIARRYEFDKIIHVESDAYVLSVELAIYLNSLDSGWTALWCPRWRSPETGFQVICRDQFDAMRKLGSEVPSTKGKPVEVLLPFTHVEQGFAGDRYGEFSDFIPPHADYAMQVHPGMTVRYRTE